MDAEQKSTEEASPDPRDKRRSRLAGGLTAKASCKKCYGRGYVGKNDRGKLVPCRCVKVV